MFDRNLVSDIITLIEENLEIVLQRTEHIESVNDFTSGTGMILLDSVCMKLVAVGESIKSLDKISNKELLTKYSQIDWKQAMGMRDIIVHHYFDIDAEQIFSTLKEDIPILTDTLKKMRNDLNRNNC